jgi:hypothetical protein
MLLKYCFTSLNQEIMDRSSNLISLNNLSLLLESRLFFLIRTNSFTSESYCFDMIILKINFKK